MQVSASEYLLRESCGRHSLTHQLLADGSSEDEQPTGTSREKVVAKGGSFLNSKIDDTVLERTSAGR